MVVHLCEGFDDIRLPPVDDAFIALGTTIKAAGSQAAFRAVDFDAVVSVARAARAAGASRLGAVSAMRASSKSAILYNRVKGDMEAAVGALGFGTVVIARPSLLLGDRSGLQQSARSGESVAAKIMPWISPLLPANYKPVQATQVAQALVGALQTSETGTHVLLSADIGQYA